MTATLAPSGPSVALDWRRALLWGGSCALSLVSVSLIGLPVGMNKRILIEPVLSLGYLFLLWIPLVSGYVATTVVVLEGVEARKSGVADLLAGLTAGLMGGIGLTLLMVGLDTVNIRKPLVNWSPQLFRLLTFERGLEFGIPVWLGICAGLGLVGAVLHQLPAVARRVMSWVLFGVMAVAILEAVIDDLAEGFHLEWLTDALYYKKGGTEGLTVTSAVVLALVLAALPVVTGGRVKAAVDHYRDAPSEDRRRTSLVLFGAIAVACVGLPMILGGIVNELLANVGLFLLLALGLNIVVGLAGLLDLGYVAFFAVGGYTTSVLTSSNSPFFAPEWHFGIALLFVVVMAAVAGLVIGAPVIRMRGDYLAIVTLGFGEIVRLLFLSDWLKPYFGGSQGITKVNPVEIGPFKVQGSDPRSVFYLVLVFCALAIYVSWRLQGSRLGRAWMATREDEQVAEAMGINTVNAKLMAFVVGATMAAFSGAVLAAKVGSVFPKSFEILVSSIILVVVIVGGMGNIAGVMVGSLVLIGILGGPRQPGLLQEFQSYKLLIYGALLVFMMLKRPEGLVPSARRSRELHQDEYLQDAWLGDDAESEEDQGAPS